MPEKDTLLFWAIQAPCIFAAGMLFNEFTEWVSKWSNINETAISGGVLVFAAVCFTGPGILKKT